MPNASFRAFVAIELPEAVRQPINALIEHLKTQDSSETLRWMRPEGVHLTLKFLGTTRESRVESIGAALRVAASAVPPFELEFGPLGSFGSRRSSRGQVIWTGIEGDLTQLREIVRLIDSAFERVGIEPELRPFTPHLTLGRGRRSRTPLPPALFIDTVWPPPVARFPVETVSLMQSDLRPEGARYTTRLTVPLPKQPASS